MAACMCRLTNNAASGLSQIRCSYLLPAASVGVSIFSGQIEVRVHRSDPKPEGQLPPRSDVLPAEAYSQKRLCRLRPLADIPAQLQTRPMHASAALALFSLASCGAAPLVKQALEASQSGDERRITGVLTLYTEGESFRQCPLREPWKCPEAKGPECGFDATPEARSLINREITKAGAT